MPTNQSSPWGGGKLRARSNTESPPSAASLCAQDKTAAVSKVPFSRSSAALPAGDGFTAPPPHLLPPSGPKQPGAQQKKCAPRQSFEAGEAPPSDGHQEAFIRGQPSSQLTPEAADSPPVPHLCLTKHPGGALGKSASGHYSTKLEMRSTRRHMSGPRRSHSAKTAARRSPTQNGCPTPASLSGQLLVRGGPPAVLGPATSSGPPAVAPLGATKQAPESRGVLTQSAGSGSGPSPHSFMPAVLRAARPEVLADEASHPAGALVGSVTSQISAIHLTRQGQPSSVSSPSLSSSSSSSPSPTDECVVGEAQLSGSESVMQVDGAEEELPDELENACSDDDDSDCSSIIGTSSTASGTLLSSVEEPMVLEAEDSREERPALVPSLFPLFAPTLYFSTANEKVELLPAEQRRLLKWKLSAVTPNVVKLIVDRSHFKLTKKSHDWLGCWGHHMRSSGFKSLGEHQKLNHFPGTFQIGRKDRLWRNLSKMRHRFGKQDFSFFPRTFILPQDIKLLRKTWEDSGSKQKWIIKPPASARGLGIQVIHKWSQMPRKRPLLVQKYLHKPYLISGNKFDLRIYVYVTSYDPLRIYIFSDGLVRFASCKYSSSMKTLSNKFMHLTNYSVNKKNSEYQTNSDDKACQGHKWALKALWQYLGSKGVNTTLIWEKIKDIVIKTIIASEPYVNSLLKMHVKTPYSCHELFGFDIMLDENLKPWILEVNISPSLHSNSALDVSVKGQMIRDLLNLAGFRIPPREEVSSSCSSASSSTSSLSGGTRERTKPDLSPDEKVKRAFYLTQRDANRDFLSSVLDVLTPEDVRVLAESEDELSRCGEFERLFPSPSSTRYLRFFETPRYLNILLDQWEQKYWNNRPKGISLLGELCQKGVHLGTSDPAHMWSKCSYVSRFEPQRPDVTVPSRSRVVVSHQKRWHRRISDGDCSDAEVAPQSPGSSVASSACASPQPGLTQNLLSPQPGLTQNLLSPQPGLTQNLLSPPFSPL
ncbi:tubulin monoglutamylase TTLL4 [Leuresthes tenuis]|uniref:tubulin monoglutamylase TTLL4 n=1 Tax=Leuresthes tenuis TaxID=355514 RepID=UPI003B507699